MNTPIQKMSLAEYAEQQAQFGAKVIYRNGCYWRRVRPFFYRPILPLETFSGENARAGSWLNGFQYVVPSGKEANSTMNFVMLDDLQNYSLSGLTHKRRQLIKRAAQQFQVRPIQNLAELKEHGHKVYLSFFERTKYSYRSDRKNKAIFDHWAETLFSNPKTILIGGYGPDGLSAISTSYWVNNTFIYATLICESAAMHLNLGELMFHEIRLLAGQQSEIREIFVRSYQGGNARDQYYLRRGCHLVRKPSKLDISPSVQTLLRCLMPKKYRLLCGND